MAMRTLAQLVLAIGLIARWLQVWLALKTYKCFKYLNKQTNKAKKDTSGRKVNNCRHEYANIYKDSKILINQ